MKTFKPVTPKEVFTQKLTTMDRKELKVAIRYEYQLTTNEYLALSLSNESLRDGIMVFDIWFPLNHATSLHCTRKIKQGIEEFEIIKISTIEHNGDIYSFTTIEQFIKYIKLLPLVRLILKY